MPKPFTVVILTALQLEFKAVQKHVASPREIVHRGTIYETGIFSANGQEWEVGIAEIGAGNPGAAAEAERAISYFDPTYIFFVGVAGGIKDVKLGDVVAATKIYDYEFGKDKKQFQPRPEVASSTHALIQRARAEARKDDWLKRMGNLPEPPPSAFVGPIAAGEKVVASKHSATFRLIRSNYSDALAVEMEGHGFLKAAHVSHPVEAIVIRGISDLIQGKSKADESGSQEIAARSASAFAFEVLAKLGGSSASDSAPPVPSQAAVTILSPPSPEEPNFPIFQVPYRHNPNFTARNDIIATLNQNFGALPGQIAPQVITGLGGVGKTRVAVEYAYQYADQYDLIGWVRAEEDATLAADYLTLANALLLPVKANAEQLVFVNIVRHWLENTLQRWLIIFDNVEDTNSMRDLLPARGNGHVLITSRNPNWHGIAHPIPLKPFTLE
ncbi:MAG: hypothetical protein OIN84_17355, partial [Candidatus Methanoperedens sp.]|nr:hypothetical protein [Candidatus Methanoperedens sp.]